MPFIRSLTATLLLLCSLMTQAQDTLVLTGGDRMPAPLFRHAWHFEPGDDTAWANPSFTDSHWQRLNPHFGEDSLPKGWKGYGWFRLWVKKPAGMSLTAWGLRINHDGASEIYWDGDMAGTIGAWSTTRQSMKAARAPYTIFPVVITDTLPHLLAIRYANFDPPFYDFVGVQAWMGDMHRMNSSAIDEQRFYDFLLLSVAVQGILIILHLLLFFFYPANRLNLYYSLFVLSTLITSLSRYLTIVTHDPYTQFIAYKTFFTGIHLVTFTGALLLYSVSYIRLPRWRLRVTGGITLLLTLYTLIRWQETLVLTGEGAKLDRFLNIFTLLVFIDGTRSVIMAIRRGNKRLWLIAAGMVIMILLSVFVGSNILGWFTFRTVMATMGIGTLVMPVAFSIYLATDVAHTNRRLAQQLKDNALLAAQNLAQEQEKGRLITEQAVKLEQTVQERTAQVRRQADKLQEMDAMKSRFFVNLTHEFKTPLTLILNPARELLQQSSDVASRRYAQLIVSNGERLQQLINQLLDLSRLESGQLEVNPEPAELAQWLRTHVGQYQSLAFSQQLSLTFQTAVATLWVMADLDKLEKMVQNLLSNAIKFTGQQGHISVTLEQQPAQRTFTIAVSDTGAGIEAAKLPYIFDRFYQADASGTRSREGTGIGLALTKELAGLLGGDISVTSEAGKGTVFTLCLPATPVAPVSLPAPAGEAVAALPGLPDPGDLPPSGFFVEAADAGNDQRPLVLLAEDNSDLRAYVNLALGSRYQLLMATDGQEGIELALEQIPALVITDLMMPRKGGYELCQTLKTDERTSHIPIIMLTALADQDSRIQGIETGADAYLAKPFDKRELLAQAGNLIRTRQQLREKFGQGNAWLSGLDQLPSIEQTFLQKVKDAIEAHIDDSGFGAEQLAQALALHRTQLHRKLKQLIDQSPGELIRTIRLQMAHRLLEQQAATVAEVCYQVGYANPANFSTSFSRHFGYPPGAAKR